MSNYAAHVPFVLRTEAVGGSCHLATTFCYDGGPRRRFSQVSRETVIRQAFWMLKRTLIVGLLVLGCHGNQPLETHLPYVCVSFVARLSPAGAYIQDYFQMDECSLGAKRSPAQVTEDWKLASCLVMRPEVYLSDEQERLYLTVLFDPARPDAVGMPTNEAQHPKFIQVDEIIKNPPPPGRHSELCDSLSPPAV